MVKELLIRLLLALLSMGIKIQIYPLAKFMGYRRFEPKPNTVLVSCCTNGLGHIHQLERVLGTLQEEGMKFPVIALAREQKVPAYKLAALKERFPGTPPWPCRRARAADSTSSRGHRHQVCQPELRGGLRQRQVLQEQRDRRQRRQAARLQRRWPREEGALATNHSSARGAATPRRASSPRARRRWSGY